MGGELQHVSGTPEAGVTTAQLLRDGGDGVVDGGLLLQLTVGSQVPLADVGSFVTGILLHVLTQGLNALGQHHIVAEAAGLGGVLTGLEQSAAGTADGLGSESILKLHALSSQLVQVGGNVQGLAVAAAGVPALLVGEIEDNVISH